MNVRRHHHDLRSLVLALLVLGQLILPVLHVVCQANSIGHALVAAHDPHRVHFEGDKDDPGDFGQSGAKHAHGANSDWNLGGGPTFAPVPPMFALTLLQRPRVALPPMAAPAIDPHAPTSPFRPPIA